ncbi:MAG TPA: AEC family transporter [Holophaga sp.]|nr:AEC family transporter [Holophaga sp.]
MLAAVLSVLTIFVLIGVGFFLTRRRFFDDAAGMLFTRTVICVSLPPMMVYELTNGFTRADLLHAGRALLIPAASYTCCALVAPFFARLSGVPKGRRGTFVAMFVASNTIFIGMPVNLALFGPASVPSVLLAYVVNTTYFWTLGEHAIESDAGRPRPMFSWDHLGQILSPPFMGFVVGVALVFLGIKLPAFLASAMKLLGGMTTPLSLLFMGITFAGVSLKEIRFTRDMVALFFGRFILAPAMIYVFYLLLPVPPLMAKVFMVQAGMPAITQAALSAKHCDADYRYATVMVSATNLASLAVLPLYMALFHIIFPH